MILFSDRFHFHHHHGWDADDVLQLVRLPEEIHHREGPEREAREPGSAVSQGSELRHVVPEQVRTSVFGRAGSLCVGWWEGF